MNDVVPLLIRQAEEIATEGHNGWGNSMLMAADEITRLREQVRVLREALADAHVFMQIMMEEHGDHGVRLLIKDTEAALEATKP